MDSLDHAELGLVGDSILYHEQRYPHIRTTILQKKVANLCQRGLTIKGVLDQFPQFPFDPKAANLPDDIRFCSKVVLHIGTNNLIDRYNTTPNDPYETAQKIIIAINRLINHSCASPTMGIYFLGLLPRCYDSDSDKPDCTKKPDLLNPAIRQINKHVKNYCRQHPAVYIDPPRILTTPNGSAVKDIFMMMFTLIKVV